MPSNDTHIMFVMVCHMSHPLTVLGKVIEYFSTIMWLTRNGLGMARNGVGPEWVPMPFRGNISKITRNPRNILGKS